MTEQEKFENLIQSSQLLIRATKERGDDFSILTELYSDPSHFVYEILQNAEDNDVAATKVEFELFDDRLEINHNAEKDFTFENVRKLVITGNSDKRDNVNEIGQFGIGFKSVFAVTETPIIHSGNFHFRIKDLFLPERISPISVNGTKFILPFNHSKRTKKEIYELIESRMQNIGATFLLFLNNIQEVSWKIGTNSGFYARKTIKVAGLENVWKASIKSENNSDNYLIFGKPVAFGEKDLLVKIAYQFKGKKLVPVFNEHFLHAFFETNVRTSLNFLVHAPFRTTPARDNIPFENEENIKLIEKISELVAESIEKIRDLGKLSIDFYEKVLPLQEPKSQGIIYSKTYQKVLEVLKNRKVLPSSMENRYVFAEDALIARGKDLVELFKTKDLKSLFRKSNFLKADITSDKMPKLWHYLKVEVGIREIRLENIVDSFNPSILKGKSDNWLIHLYKLFAQVPNLHTKLRFKSFVRIEDGRHLAPFNYSNQEPKVFLPTDLESNYPTVKKKIYNNKDCAKFLKVLGLRKPEILDEINHFVMPIYKAETIPSDDHYRSFKKFLDANFSISLDEKRELIKKIKDIPFVYSSNFKTNKYLLCFPRTVYFQDKELILLFAKNEEIFFVAETLYEKFEKEIEKINEFLKDCGVNKNLKIVETNYSIRQDRYNFRDKYKLPRRLQSILKKGAQNSDHSFKDYKLDQQDWILTQIQEEHNLSFIFWNQILAIIKNFGVNSLRGQYVWHYYEKKSEWFDADFIVTLRTEKWLLDKTGNLSKPSQITLSDLHPNYDIYSKEANNLIDKLHFKLDETKSWIENAPDEFKDSIEIVEMAKQEGLTDDEIKEAIEDKKKKKEILAEKENIQNWKPKISPEKVPIKIINYFPSTVIRKPRKNIEQVINPKEVEMPEEQEVENTVDIKNEIDNKEIGDWGEKYVFDALKGKYEGKVEETEFGARITNENQGTIEIHDLNKKGLGVGCDFEIKINGDIVEFIEVKSKTESNPSFIDLTGVQWNLAQQEKEKYWIYVVYNAGNEDCGIITIKNPFALWENGNLPAQVVRIKLHKLIG